MINPLWHISRPPLPPQTSKHTQLPPYLPPPPDRHQARGHNYLGWLWHSCLRVGGEAVPPPPPITSFLHACSRFFMRDFLIYFQGEAFSGNNTKQVQWYPPYLQSCFKNPKLSSRSLKKTRKQFKRQWWRFHSDLNGKSLIEKNEFMQSREKGFNNQREEIKGIRDLVIDLI